MAWKKTGCDVWQLECQASNVTASVQSDDLLHGYMLPVFSPLINCIIHHALLKFSRCCNKTLLQLVCLHYGLVLDTRGPAACPRRGNLPSWGQDRWLGTRQDWWTGVSHAQKFACVMSTMCWRIVLPEDKQVSRNATDRWQQHYLQSDEEVLHFTS